MECQIPVAPVSGHHTPCNSVSASVEAFAVAHVFDAASGNSTNNPPNSITHSVNHSHIRLRAASPGENRARSATSDHSRPAASTSPSLFLTASSRYCPLRKRLHANHSAGSCTLWSLPSSQWGEWLLGSWLSTPLSCRTGCGTRGPRWRGHAIHTAVPATAHSGRPRNSRDHSATSICSAGSAASASSAMTMPGQRTPSPRRIATSAAVSSRCPRTVHAAIGRAIRPLRCSGPSEAAACSASSAATRWRAPTM